MTKYAIIRKPYHLRVFTIYFRYHTRFLEAIRAFKESSDYNKRLQYAIFNVTETDNETDFHHIIDF